MVRLPVNRDERTNKQQNPRGEEVLQIFTRDGPHLPAAQIVQGVLARRIQSTGERSEPGAEDRTHERQFDGGRAILADGGEGVYQGGRQRRSSPEGFRGSPNGLRVIPCIPAPASPSVAPMRSPQMVRSSARR